MNLKNRILFTILLCISSSLSAQEVLSGAKVQGTAISNELEQRKSEKSLIENNAAAERKEMEAKKEQRMKYDKELLDVLQQPESAQNTTTIATLQDKINELQKQEKGVNERLTQSNQKIEQLNQTIKQLTQKQEELTRSFTAAPESDIEQTSFTKRIMLQFKKWVQELRLSWGLGNIRELRSDLETIYKKLESPFAQARNAQALAQLLPELSMRIGKNIETLDLYLRANKEAPADKKLITQEVERVVGNLIQLREQLTDPAFASIEGATRAAIDNKIETTLKELGLSEQQRAQLLKKPTQANNVSVNAEWS